MKILSLLTCLGLATQAMAEDYIPFNQDNWDIQAQAHVLEHYRGKDAIYIQQGAAMLKDVEFLNGTIEFDVFLTERQAFPGVGFREFDEQNYETFFLRPHLSGKPDANQAASVINGMVGWQLYFGERYSFPYEYKFDDWTHIRLVVNGEKAQVFLDYSKTPQLSWIMKNPTQPGKVSIGGSFAPMHYANVQITPGATALVDFKVDEIVMIEGVIPGWSISDKFAEQRLEDLENLDALIDERSWTDSVEIDETNVANIARVSRRYPGEENTVFAKIIIHSDADRTRRMEFGYSDRVVAILNGKPIYGGNNKWRSRDYRYLGTVGFFDGIYLDLKEGENTLLMAVSEDFGGWGVTGKFLDYEGIKISH
jgi:hypothetical protein